MKYTVWFVGLMCTFNAFGGLITFDLLGDAAVYSLLDNQVSGSVTNSGLIVTVTASDGVLNRTDSAFGINGPGTDDTDAFNAGQFMDLVFNQDVTFSSVTVSSWGSSDAAEVQLGPLFSFQGSITNTGETAFDFGVTEGTTVRILATADSGATNGFSVNSFTVETIPEPAVIGLIGLGSGVMMLLTRKRRR